MFSSPVESTATPASNPSGLFWLSSPARDAGAFSLWCRSARGLSRRAVHGQIKGNRQGCSGLPCSQTRSASISGFPDRQPCWDVPLEYISQSGQRATIIPQAGLGNVDGPVSPWSHEGCTLSGATGWSVIHERLSGDHTDLLVTEGYLQTWYAGGKGLRIETS